jgi:hypothetical protein
MMAGSPKFKVYRGKEYIGSLKYAEDAAALVALNSDGIVKYDHRDVVWNEGHEEFPAGESYDRAADVMYERIRQASSAATHKRAACTA